MTRVTKPIIKKTLLTIMLIKTKNLPKYTNVRKAIKNLPDIRALRTIARISLGLVRFVENKFTSPITLQTEKGKNGAKSIQVTPPQEETCIFCSKVYKNRNTLKSHVNNVHKNEKDEGEYKCELCDFQSNKEGYLKKHIKINHVQSTRLNCDNCEFSCLSKSGLGRHINLVHKAASDLAHEESDVLVESDEDSDVPVESDEENYAPVASDENGKVPEKSDVSEETVERILSFSEL